MVPGIHWEPRIASCYSTIASEVWNSLRLQDFSLGCSPWLNTEPAINKCCFVTFRSAKVAFLPQPSRSERRHELIEPS